MRTKNSIYSVFKKEGVKVEGYYTAKKMDSRSCLGVLWDHKYGTFDKLYHTSQKFHFKSKKEAIENL